MYNALLQCSPVHPTATNPVPYSKPSLRIVHTVTPPKAPLLRYLTRRNSKSRSHESKEAHDISATQSRTSIPTPFPESIPKTQSNPQKGKTKDIPIRVISTTLTPQQRLLPRQIRIMPPHQIAILLCRQEGDEVDSRPHLFPCEFTVTYNQPWPSIYHRRIQFMFRTPTPPGRYKQEK